MNQGRRPYSWQDHACPALDPSEVTRRRDEGVVILDIREPGDFALGHLPGAWNVQLSSPQFEQRVGWILPPGQKILLVVAEPGSEYLAVRKLSFVGLDQRVQGALAHRAWREEGLRESRLAQLDVRRLRQSLSSGDLALLDVREQSEWDAGHIEGAMHLPLLQLGEGFDDLGVDPGRELAVICAGGFRSSTACSLLVGMGFVEVCNVVGGMAAWDRAQLPLGGDR